MYKTAIFVIMFAGLGILQPQCSQAKTKGYSQTQVALFSCIRHVIQHPKFGETPEISALSEIAFETMIDGISPSSIHSSSIDYLDRLQQCKVIARTRLSRVGSDLFLPAKASPGMRELLIDMQSPGSFRCTGVSPGASVAALLAVSAGANAHYCVRADGRSGIFVGLRLGAGIGAGFSLDAVTDSDVIFSHSMGRFVSFSVGWNNNHSWGVGEIADEDDNTIGPSLGAALMSIGTFGFSIKVIPLGTPWQKVISYYFDPSI